MDFKRNLTGAEGLSAGRRRNFCGTGWFEIFFAAVAG